MQRPGMIVVLVGLSAIADRAAAAMADQPRMPDSIYESVPSAARTTFGFLEMLPAEIPC